MQNNFISSVQAPDLLTAPALWFLFYGEYILLEKTGDKLILPQEIDIKKTGLHVRRQHYLGAFNNQHCFTGELMEPVNANFEVELKLLRRAYDDLGQSLFPIASRAKHILGWDKFNQFCNYCGNKVFTSEHERAKVCNNCGRHIYPLISPAIIVLIKRDYEILLARSPHFNPGMYSTLAGFIEPGETAEQAVEREIMEEVGLQVKNIRYFGSQPWPFPHSLMLGFTADYASGDIKVDEREIEAAAWFNLNSLPELPSHASISRQLIDSFIASQKNK